MSNPEQLADSRYHDGPWLYPHICHMQKSCGHPRQALLPLGAPSHLRAKCVVVRDSGLKASGSQNKKLTAPALKDLSIE